MRRSCRSARPSGKLQQLDVTVLMGDPRLPDAGQARRHVQSGGPRDHPHAQGRAVRAAELQVPLPRQPRARSSATSTSCAPISSSTCATRASTTTPSRSCTSRRCWRCWASPTPARGRPALAACYDKGLVRAVAHDARRAGAARDLRAPRRPGRDAAVGVPGAAEAQLRRQLAGHHQGRRGAQREGAARLPRPAARRVPQARPCWCRSS